MSYKTYWDKSQDTNRDWNLNAGFGDVVILPLCVNVNNARQLSDMVLWYNALNTLIANVAGHPSINVQALNTIKVGLKTMRKSIPDQSVQEALLNSMQRHRLKKVKEKLGDFHEQLITEIYKSGLLFPKSQGQDAKFAGLNIK